MIKYIIEEISFHTYDIMIPLLIISFILGYFGNKMSDNRRDKVKQKIESERFEKLFNLLESKTNINKHQCCRCLGYFTSVITDNDNFDDYCEFCFEGN